jgi:hypothetical protein
MNLPCGQVGWMLAGAALQIIKIIARINTTAGHKSIHLYTAMKGLLWPVEKQFIVPPCVFFLFCLEILGINNNFEIEDGVSSGNRYLLSIVAAGEPAGRVTMRNASCKTVPYRYNHNIRVQH